MEYQEEDYLSLSGIQHFEFCRRQWALIHIEQQWQENVRTLEGEYLHKNAHDSENSTVKNGIIISKGMPIFSKTMGVNGVCDVVEFHKSEDGVTIFDREGLYSPLPVEYKRGEPKSYDADELQLCAQAMCIEEMLMCHIEHGFLYYGEIRHRHSVNFNEQTRNKVKEIFQEMHQYYQRRYTPKVKTTKGCKACSLADICLPKLCKNISVNAYISKNIGEETDEKVT